MSEDLPEPLTPMDCDLRGLPYMPLDTSRLLDSDFMALATDEEFRFGMTLWCKAWQQVPAGSLPDDDRILAHLSGARDRWCDVRDMSLHNFVKCSDGRLYHPVICEKALEALPQRRELKQHKSAASERKEREREDRARLFEALRALGIVPDYNIKTSELRELAALNNASTCHSDIAVTGHASVTAKKGREGKLSEAINKTPSESLNSDTSDPPSLLPAVTDQPDDAEIAFRQHDALRREFTPDARSVDLTPERRRHLTARLKDVGGLSGWEEILSIIRASPFLRGEASRTGFVPKIDWLLKPANLRKVREGNYDHDEHDHLNGGQRGQSQLPRSPIDAIGVAWSGRGTD